ncbi:tumor necrosis factor ligand superfamily member 10-like [Dreissena polymorpha]|uniref:THD domain-containing protein n=1 Tax=Dreissena polymorpha TaxID=45954 RepID=A0A9D4JCY8_DREPO|nr:tumor necrosis factor ligand superfamily member 10-like [Dreissena polymorpha]XP_052216799.1 tumor necrosis factor ligand superfamily member 10-like [Dreissena polymorpha]XP_052216800.1 tumor necrosis factor ligand superfamily member 10-like [Dreissena polymorpha]XP_052216801.1 tumor necrosis factor ligand superfamily member 10-like [Dreissena polymorpha]XP_052216802.1 tumor necrosis factor ligand superfamily member 10-like [Dreissena polymorpha]XP_052216803.1 tumor necrosis factor ligand s
MSTAPKELYFDNTWVATGSSIEPHYQELKKPTCTGRCHFKTVNCQEVFDSEQRTNKDITDYKDRNAVRASKLRAIIIGTSVAIIVCSVVALIAISMTIRQQETIEELQTTTENLRSRLAQLEENAKLCLPCAELSLSPFPEDTPEVADLIKHYENGQQICCAKTVNQTSIFLNLFAKRKQLEKCAQDAINAENRPSGNCSSSGSPHIPSGNAFSNVSAHMLAGPQPSNLSSDGRIRNWSVGPVAPGTHLTNIRLSSDNHSVVIAESGRYFLYSQVSFLIYYNPETPLDPRSPAQSLFHSVFRYNFIYPLGDEELLRSDVTQCWEQKKDYGRYTSYVGASVQLNKGDLIYVKVSKIGFLSRDEPGLTYFGLFKIG